MASKEEIDLVCDIQRLAIEINMQGNVHMHVNYSGHVNDLSVYAFRAPYVSNDKLLVGWGCCDHCIYLSTDYKISAGELMEDVISYKVEQLEKLKAEMSEFLVDEVVK